MRCKAHPADSRSGVGVCASCLRERLFILIAAQAQAHQVVRGQLCEDDVSRKSDSHRPPLVFPRSVSPYVSRRKSSDSAWRDQNHGDYHHNRPHHQRFYSTPQMGPTNNSDSNAAATFVTATKKQKNKFSLLSILFRSRSDKLKSDPRSRSQDACEPSSSASSLNWLSSILSARRKKQSSRISREYVHSVGRIHCQRMDRGMSPEREANAEEAREEGDRSPAGNGYSSDSPQRWRKSPVVAPGSAKRERKRHSRTASGLAFCLSPLVRASPNSHWNQKMPDMSFSGEVRVPVRPHLSTAASFSANRSRKLADLGKTPNR